MHIPVLVEKVIEFLQPKEGKIYVDATLGCGGYTEKVFSVCPKCIIIGIDWDQKAIEYTKQKLKIFLEKGNLIVVNDNFVNIKQILKDNNIDKIDGIMFDFGMSTLQIKSSCGFSFNDDTLDMRMAENFSKITAYDVVNKFSLNQLIEIFYNYGEEKFSELIAKRIIEYRKNNEIKSAKQLADIVLEVIPYSKKRFFLKDTTQEIKLRIHPATRIFQAIRIFVNNELNNIEVGVNDAIDVLSNSARVITVSYHSLEDRIVKNIFKKRNDCRIITKKPIVADGEIKINKSARSAKLRVVEKL